MADAPEETAQEALTRERKRLVLAEQKAKRARWFAARYRRERTDLFTDGFQSAFEGDDTDGEQKK